MGWSRSILFAAAAILIAVSVWYVVAQPRTAGDYRERAALTPQTLRSQVESARLWVEAVESDRVTRQPAAGAFREAEEDAAAAASAFSALGSNRRHLVLVGHAFSSTLAFRRASRYIRGGF
jgi:type II secretory pathway component PulM